MHCGSVVEEVMGIVVTLLKAESGSIKCFGGMPRFLFVQKVSRSSFVSYLNDFL